jgi:tRNA A37 threonylcarbamoyladenosine synthetase subunit TsaC/SUA5/YrdC
MNSPILKRISKMPEEIRKILRIFSPHSLTLVIPKDVGFREITKEDINKYFIIISFSWNYIMN